MKKLDTKNVVPINIGIWRRISRRIQRILIQPLIGNTNTRAISQEKRTHLHISLYKCVTHLLFTFTDCLDIRWLDKSSFIEFC